MDNAKIIVTKTMGGLKFGKGTVPAAFFASPGSQSAWMGIQGGYYASLARNLRLYRDLSRLPALLREHAIPVILLKGRTWPPTSNPGP